MPHELAKTTEPETPPTTSSLPDSLRQLVKGEEFWNGHDVAERGWLPRSVPEALRPMAQRALADLDHELCPAERHWIVGRVMALLAHYWMPDMDEKLQQAVANDWVSILGNLPRHAIERACVDYLASDTRARPTPGQILELAEAHVADKTKHRDRLRQCLEVDRPGRRGLKPMPDYRYQVEIGAMTQEEADRLMARARR